MKQKITLFLILLLIELNQWAHITHISLLLLLFLTGMDYYYHNKNKVTYRRVKNKNKYYFYGEKRSQNKNGMNNIIISIMKREMCRQGKEQNKIQEILQL